MAAADMAPLCTRCMRRHWYDARHDSRMRRVLRRLTPRRLRRR
jgi:hypothetical protein